MVNVDLHANSAALVALRPSGAKADPVYDPSNSLYRNTFTYQATLQGPIGKRDANMAAWSANNGAAFRSALKLGVSKVSQMIAMDVAGGQVDPGANDPDGAMTRLNDGTLMYTAK